MLSLRHAKDAKFQSWFSQTVPLHKLRIHKQISIMKCLFKADYCNVDKFQLDNEIYLDICIVWTRAVVWILVHVVGSMGDINDHCPNNLLFN
jgi:hypothetical protein